MTRQEKVKYNKRWREENPEKFKAQCARHRTRYAAKRREYNKLWRTANREKARKCARAWRSKNKDALRAYQRRWQKIRRASDPAYRILGYTRNRLCELLGQDRSSKTKELIGCSLKELKQHLQTQFQAGMTWENYGKEGWVVDHIVPCARFDFNIDSQLRACFHYTNLQPLWELDNCEKGAR